MAIASVDVAIIGGAVIGSSVAYHLAQRNDFKGTIAVFEKDPSYQRCASALSAASIRQQFSSSINIDISLHGIDFLRNIGELLEVDGDKPRIDLVEAGYLFLATTDKRSILVENHALQQSKGADIGFLEAHALKAKFPWLNVSDLTAGCHGLSGEGWFDGYGLMQAFRRKARSLGVPYEPVQVVHLEKIMGGSWILTLSNGEQMEAGVVVNAAGASGGMQICLEADLNIPIHSRKRMIFTFECREEVPNLPLLIDPSGTYVRPEGAGFICGSAPAEANDLDCFDYDVDYTFFEEHLWPTLANRVPAFEAIKPGAAWAGHYDMNLFDHNAFVGPVPGIEDFYIALGFSGHGLQQSPSVGRGIAEHIVTGHYETLDLSELGVERLGRNKPLIERNVV
ncbi:4-methylaminobutanoate oxidase (formaldehyde-forming) [Pseudovibrio axinellae]|uniref:4-methylaminobutanoate oxidase (Formaldehyde-forming) n=1 Tax=Pseudovibrio axinellae TaxID=989403 RepID=A0A165Z4N0_9HYPH|nr:FAD-binding oxidoreductase [Pseudovibrio axinellae]KZL19505.1 4-methylaminobutanoate oxidase (formaldehyde-forming) [Pseudovibrio axinellae]SEQ29610.1 Glycine/D-amino acid oxidase [Pseudovibrio axinellae]